MHYAAIPVSCNKSAAVSRTAQERHEDTSAVQTNGRKTRFVRVQRNLWDFKKMEKIVRGTKSKAAGIRDVVGDEKAGVSCKVLFDTIIKVWCRQCEWLVYSEGMLRRLRHFYKLLMNSDLEFHCTFIIFWLLYWSLEFHGSKIWIPYQSLLEAHQYFLKMQKARGSVKGRCR